MTFSLFTLTLKATLLTRTICCPPLTIWKLLALLSTTIGTRRRESNRQILDSFVEGLMPAFGSALSQLLGETSTGTRVLLKTPVVSNLHLLPLLFQRCTNP